MVVDITTPAWNRWPNETDADWDSFVIYRDAGPGRGWDIYGAIPSYLRRQYKQVSIINQWAERCAAYDASKRPPPQFPPNLIKPTPNDERFKRISVDMTEAAELELYKRLAATKTSSEPTITMAVLLSLIDAAVKLDRLINGAPDWTGELRTLTDSDKHIVKKILKNRSAVAMIDEILEDRKSVV